MVNNRVKQTRRRRGLTLEALAIKSQVGKSTIHDIESGKAIPTIETALKLAKAMHVLVDELFYLTKDI